MYWKSRLSRLWWHFISFLAKWASAHCLVLFTLTLSHIIATRIVLDLSCMTFIFKKFIDLCDQTTGNKERLGYRWFQSMGQSSLWYKETPLYLSSEKKRYQRSSNVSDRRSFLAGGLTCIRRRDLFVSCYWVVSWLCGNSTFKMNFSQSTSP